MASMPSTVTSPRSPPGPVARTVGRLPPASFFLTSAVFHYLGPFLAMLLFAHVAVLGVAWLRIASAAVVFAVWRCPWRILAAASRSRRWVFLALGVVLAAMNSLFYLAVDRLPLSARLSSWARSSSRRPARGRGATCWPWSWRSAGCAS
jgi:threonine/homoserine efflux transporter RhtA